MFAVLFLQSKTLAGFSVSQIYGKVYFIVMLLQVKERSAVPTCNFYTNYYITVIQFCDLQGNGACLQLFGFFCKKIMSKINFLIKKNF